MRVVNNTVYFWGGPFSQWYESEFSDGQNTFCCAEQFMMFNKALIFNDEQIADKILRTTDPKKHKQLGREIKGFNQAEWDIIKLIIVEQGNFLKFTSNDELKQLILKYDNFVEGSPHDTVWGVGLHYEDDLILDPKNWKGENLLGRALLKVKNKILQQDYLF